MSNSILRNVLGDARYDSAARFFYWGGGWKLHKVRQALRSGASIIQFVVDRTIKVPIGARLRLLRQFREVSAGVPCPHWSYEILTFVSHILRMGPDRQGVFVEAGCFRGGSTAKFSLAAALTGKRLIVFDSFEGLPDNEENRGTTIDGIRITAFEKGAYAGHIDEVRSNVAKFGRIEVCDFVKGWFEDTLPSARGALLGAYIDVDLATSTRTCIKYLFPRLVPGGIAVSQDGHLPRVLEVLDDDGFWATEVRCEKPRMVGFCKNSVVTMVKET